ncbi:MAG: hypothetical protein ACKVUT_06975 [Gaiella sp.]
MGQGIGARLSRHPRTSAIAALAGVELAVGLFQSFRERWWSSLWLLPDQPGSVWRWLTAALLAVAAVAALRLALGHRKRWAYAAGAVVLAALALDKPHELHLRVSNLALVVLVLATVATLVALMREPALARDSGSLAAVVVLLVVSTVLDAATPPGRDRYGQPHVPQRIESVVEETMETAAWALLAMVLVGAAAAPRQRTSRPAPIAPPRSPSAASTTSGGRSLTKR